MPFNFKNANVGVRENRLGSGTFVDDSEEAVTYFPPTDAL